jgi:hypothetical protein
MKFAELEQSLGTSYSPQGLLFDPVRTHVRPLQCLQYDWMHCLVVQGVVVLEINLSLHRLAGHGFTPVALRNWLSLCL